VSRYEIIDDSLTWNKILHLSPESIFPLRYKSVIEDESSCQWIAINNANNCRERIFRKKKVVPTTKREKEYKNGRGRKRKKGREKSEEGDRKRVAAGQSTRQIGCKQRHNKYSSPHCTSMLLARDTVSVLFVILPGYGKAGCTPLR